MAEIAWSGRSKKDQRPGPCRACGSAGWWNGVRRVAQVVRDVAGEIRHVVDLVRRRVCCSNSSCGAGSWTVYEESGYPHRLFQLPVVASAVAEVAFKAEGTFSQAAAGHHCHRKTVARWYAWVGKLAEPTDLVRACAHLDSAGLPPPGILHGGKSVSKAGGVLVLLDRLAHLLRILGVALRGGAPGLSALLVYQHRRFGDVRYLTRPSPPLRIDPALMMT